MIGESWGYFTVPTVFITSFSLLGIDGAAAECESPFQKSRVNHLDMDTFCQTAFKSVLQILIHAAERERREVFIPES
jgi:putative membrane protein